MSTSATYSISSSGAVESGFEIENVVTAFSSIFGVPTDKAAVYVEKQKLIKKDLSRKDAEAYKQQLMKIGMSVTLNEHTEDGNRPLAVTSEPKPDGLSLVQVDDMPSTAASSGAKTGFSCPKCQLAQSKSEQCTGCGIFFDKFKQNDAAIARAIPQEISYTDTETPRSRPTNRVQIETNDNTFSMASIALPIAAAVVGAVVWKLIAVAFGYELGLVAWGIGGAVGTAAAMTGGRGTGIGIVCALLALMAIFGGKYMTMASYQSEVAELFGDSDNMGELQAALEEVTLDAEAFATIRKDDDSIKAFMVEHEYSDAKTALFVTNAELSDFREYTQPWLEDHIDNDSSSSDWNDSDLMELERSVVGASTTSMVIDSLGPLDLLFLFLGLSTAFQLGRAGRDS
ncbi:MAG: hypothetical protein V3U76_06610 [Granulosicoccus sp.]